MAGRTKATIERRQKAPASFRFEPELLADLAALSRATQRSQVDILRTGLRIMLKRARDMGILPPESFEVVEPSERPIEMATPQLRAV